MIMREATNAADEVLKALEKLGHVNFTAHERNLIAVAYNEGLLGGNDEAHVDFEGSRKFGLHIIQEDHYDQHMDNDKDKPLWDDMLTYTPYVPSYVWVITH